MKIDQMEQFQRNFKQMESYYHIIRFKTNMQQSSAWINIEMKM